MVHLVLVDAVGYLLVVEAANGELDSIRVGRRSLSAAGFQDGFRTVDHHHLATDLTPEAVRDPNSTLARRHPSGDAERRLPRASPP